jgi:hypothetical protein
MNSRRFAVALVLAVATAGYSFGQTAAPSPAVGEPFRAEIEQFIKADKVAPPAPCQVLFVGSSSIVHWKETLATDMAPMPVINRGFGGSQIEHVNRWFDEIVAPYRPRAIVLYAGENDIDAGQSVERVVADFDEFMTLKARVLGTTAVYFISLKPSTLRFAELPLQRQVNAAIRARAGKREDLHYIDVAALMIENGKPKDVFMEDGLHMNAKGYAIWTAAVRAAMLPRTNAEASDCRRQDKP